MTMEQEDMEQEDMEQEDMERHDLAERIREYSTDGRALKQRAVFGIAPEPAVVVGDDSEGCTDADPDQDGAKFGWSAMEVAGWLRDHGYLDSPGVRDDLAGRFFDLGLVREAHNLSPAATTAGKNDPRALLLPGFGKEG